MCAARYLWTPVVVGMSGAGLLAAGCMPDGLLITPVTTNRELVEETLVREPGLFPDKIALIDVTGILLNRRQSEFLGEGEHPVSLLLEQLDKARRDPGVKAAVLRINSPGGSVTAAELIHNEIQQFRAGGKPVIAVMMDVAASGGYYVACACDEIWAHKSTVTGSIGVMAQFLDVSGTMQKIGMSAPAITSGPNKAAGSPFAPLSPEQREIFQSIVDGMYEGFLEVVKQGRPNLSEEQIREAADGRVYAANQALELGLIDRIGTLREAFSAAKEQVGAKSVRVVGYRRPLAYRPNYYARAGEAPVTRGRDVNVINVDLPGFLRDGTPQFLYLWVPGM
ncbi:MAG: signal peptide peptidase SppA [Phycisphaerales bacterium]|nr:MAG: signal peptide peptidase SppA [Phycisphaerales bacterium]